MFSKVFRLGTLALCVVRNPAGTNMIGLTSDGTRNTRSFAVCWFWSRRFGFSVLRSVKES